MYTKIRIDGEKVAEARISNDYGVVNGLTDFAYWAITEKYGSNFELSDIIDFMAEITKGVQDLFLEDQLEREERNEHRNGS